MKTILTLFVTGCLAIAAVAAQSRSASDQFQEALRLEEVKGDLKGAIEQYRKLVDTRDRAIAAKALVQMARCYEMLGRSDARSAYERVVREFADQTESAAAARAALAAITRGDGHVQLAWFDRTGRQIETVGGPGGYRGPELSPDGRRLAIRDQDLNSGDIWIFDVGRRTASRLTQDDDGTRTNSMPIWSPDGKRIVFGSFRSGKYGLYVTHTFGSGVEDLLVESEFPTTPMSWSPDGMFIVYTVRDPTQASLWVLPLSGDRQPSRLFAGSSGESHGQISPDGKWIAYAGRGEVFVRPFPEGPGEWRVSAAGGNFPRWRGDGKELYFMSTGSFGKMMAAEIRVSGPSVEPGTPRALFDSGYDNSAGGRSIGHWHTYAVSADGQRFLIPRPVTATIPSVPPPTAGPVNGFAGPWSAPSRDVNNYRVAADSLSFRGLAVTDQRMERDATSRSIIITRRLAAPIGAGRTATVYFSVLMRPEGVLGQGGPEGGSGFFGVDLLGSSANRFFGKPGRQAPDEYVLEQQGGTGQVSTGMAAVVGQTVFLVVRADLRPGPDAFTLYFNPDPCRDQPVSGTVKNDLDLGELRSVGMFAAGAFSFDAFRMGPTFSAVAPCAVLKR